MFDAIKKLLIGAKQKDQGLRHLIQSCPDCGVGSGEFHELFCTKERCPFCGGQLASCDCISKVLKLSKKEQQAVDEYVDDSIPPLSNIIQRWEEALANKGRVPFESFPDDPIRAAYRGDAEAVTRFLDDGFPPNSGNEVGYTALMGAARGESLEVIRLLLSRGGKAALPDKRGYTALHWLVAQQAMDSKKQVDCVRALVEAGADANARNEDGITPLMNAAWFGCYPALQELLRRGADPKVSDKKGRTARDLASERSHMDIVELLK